MIYAIFFFLIGMGFDENAKNVGKKVKDKLTDRQTDTQTGRQAVQ